MILVPIFLTEWIPGRALNLTYSLFLADVRIAEFILICEYSFDQAHRVYEKEQVLDRQALGLVHEVDDFAVIATAIHPECTALWSDQVTKSAQRAS